MASYQVLLYATYIFSHSLTAALDQLRVVASSTSNDLGLRSRQHQQTGQCLLPLFAAIFFVDDPAADTSSQQTFVFAEFNTIIPRIVYT